MLVEEIKNKAADEYVRAKNFATLEKYLRNMPANEIDPQHIEKNNINICFHIAGQNFTLSQKDLYKLPQSKVMALLHSISNEIIDVEAEEIMNT